MGDSCSDGDTSVLGKGEISPGDVSAKSDDSVVMSLCRRETGTSSVEMDGSAD